MPQIAGSPRGSDAAPAASWPSQPPWRHRAGNQQPPSNSASFRHPFSAVAQAACANWPPAVMRNAATPCPGDSVASPTWLAQINFCVPTAPTGPGAWILKTGFQCQSGPHDAEHRPAASRPSPVEFRHRGTLHEFEAGIVTDAGRETAFRPALEQLDVRIIVEAQVGELQREPFHQLAAIDHENG